MVAYYRIVLLLQVMEWFFLRRILLRLKLFLFASHFVEYEAGVGI
jgi:hypothetical protein